TRLDDSARPIEADPAEVQTLDRVSGNIRPKFLSLDGDIAAQGAPDVRRQRAKERTIGSSEVRFLAADAQPRAHAGGLGDPDRPRPRHSARDEEAVIESTVGGIVEVEQL